MQERDFNIKTVDAYLAAQPRATAKILKQLREIILNTLPEETEEVISYAIPTYKVKKKPVVYFSGYDKHFSLYPRPQNPSAKFAEELKPHVAGKGTLRFDLKQPVPADLIKRVVEHRLKDVLAGK